MTKLRLLFFLQLLPLLTFAQSGYFDNNPIWKMHSACGVLYPCVENKDYNYYIAGDTTFNQHTYKKLFISGTGSYSWFSNPPVPISCTGLISFHDSINAYAFLRDTLSKIFIVINNNPEALLYDFNLSVGDTLPLTYNNYNTDYTIVSIDSIRVGLNYRKRFQLSNNSPSHYLIEGMGHDLGFIEPFPPILECGYTLDCFGLADSAYYPVLGTSCIISSGIEEAATGKPKFKIYPNPSTNIISIDVNASIKITSLKVFNVFGDLMTTYKINSGSNIKIDLSKYESGFYILEINDERNACYYERVAKI